MSDDMRSRWDKSRWAAWLSEPWAETPEMGIIVGV